MSNVQSKNNVRIKVRKVIFVDFWSFFSLGGVYVQQENKRKRAGSNCKKND